MSDIVSGVFSMPKYQAELPDKCDVS